MKFTRADAHELTKNMPDADIRLLCEDLYADLLNRQAETHEDASEVRRRIMTHRNVTVNVSTSGEAMKLSQAQVDEIVRKIQEKLIQQARRTRPHGFS